MRSPRRYRLALLAYPAAYRGSRGTELLATLAEGDEDRGRPSTHEAAALAYRGILLRARVATTPEGLLVAAAVVVLIALLGGFTWAERVYLYDGEAAAWGTDGPGLWWALALGVCALVVLLDGPLRSFVARSPRRRTLMVAVAFGLGFLTGPGQLLHRAVSDPAGIHDYVVWQVSALYANWSELTLPVSVATVLGTTLALRVLRLLSPDARRRALGAALAALAAVVVALTWSRPDLPAEYGQSAFADLEAATFIAAAGLVLAAVASLRLARRRGWDSNPRGT